uniref:Uncharacterized protein n=1 Tax=Tanacetum cinerariifolium TaxID=118510 RepID=A0A6L2K3K1_TANCI|nr:hypothetical protein [Tanacetum cinerariifolium]
MPVYIIVKDIRTMDMTIDQQVALDEALVHHASRIRIGKSNFCLRSDITFKESTLQLVYDFLRLTPFYKAFLVTADVSEIYMQEFWATATVHHHSIRFKMDNKKRIVNLEYFREMLHICPRLHDFVYQVEYKDAKKSNEMYHPRDDQMFTMIKLVSRHQNIQQFGVMFPVELTNEDIRNSEAYKEYYAIASGAAPPKTKASVRKTKSSSDTTITPLTVAGTRLSTLAKGKQPAKSSKEKGLIVLSEVAMTEAEQKKLAMKSSDEDDDDDVDERSNDDASLGLNVGGKEGQDAEDNDEELYSDVNINLEVPQAPTPSTTAPSTFLQDLSNFGSLFGFDHRLKTLKANFSEFMQTNQFAGAVSYILGIVERYMDQRMNETVKEQVKEQVKASYAVAVDLSEMELKEILIEKIESNKSIHQSDEQRNLYKDLADAYKSDKIILDTYGDTVTLKRHRDDADKDKEPSVGSDRGSKKRKEGKETESTSTPKEKGTKTTGKSTQGSKSHHKTTSESVPAEEPIQTTKDMEEPSHQEFETGAADDQPITKASQHPEWFQIQKKPIIPNHAWNKTLPATHGSIQPWISDLAKQADSRSSFNELMDTHVNFLAFLLNRIKVNTLTPELLAGPTYELMKGSCKSLVELEFFPEKVYKAPTDQLDWNNPEGHQYPHNLLKPLSLRPNSRGRRVIPFDHFINNDLEYLRGSAPTRISLWGRKRQQFYGFAVNKESARDVYSKRRIIAVTELQIVEWHNYKHLDWIMARRDDDKLYKFKEGDFKRLHIQDIEDMLLILIQGKLTNLTVEERFAFNVSLRMFTRSIVTQRCVKDLQLGDKSYQKKLKLTNSDTYCSDLKRKEAYTAYSNPRRFIYQNKDMQNRLIWINELHKFSDGMLNDVQTDLDDRLKGIQMKYMPQAIWRKSNKERASAMIQAIDK